MKKEYSRKLLESTILGVAGLIAFTIIAIIVYFLGVALNIRSLRSGFTSEVYLILDFPLFFIIVSVIKIFVGGELIDFVTRFFSRAFKVKIFVEKGKNSKKH